MLTEQTRTVRGSDYSPAIELSQQSEQKDKLVTATGDTEKYSEKQANKVWLNSIDIEQKRNSDINKGPLLCCKFAKFNALQSQPRYY